MEPPAPVDPAKIPALSGVFAPVHEEHDVAGLTVHGEIPGDLRGAYLRNGPNPLFPPLGSYTFPLEGDAMLHGIWIDDDGSARYRNRIVWNPQLRLEQAAGKALWAGLMTPYLPGPDVVPAEYANGWKPTPFINIVHHGGRWLALSEVDPPWEVTAQLDVVGTTPFTWDGAIPGMCAHPRIDPRTGEMVLFRYDLAEPYLLWAAISADGTVGHAPDPVELDGAYMIHDFALTERFVVLFVAPAEFDLNALMTGTGDPLAWNAEKPLRIAVIPRDGTSADVRWVETDPFWVYHFANAYDDGDEIVVDLARFDHFALGKATGQTGAAARARIDPVAGMVRLSTFDDRIVEFPRIDDRLQTRPHRFFTVSGKTAGRPTGEFNVLIRVDTQTGATTEWDSGNKVFDEVVFAARDGGGPEEGYYVTFRTDLETLRSDWVVLDASDITAGPVATVELPFRVPAGLHGNWFAS
jgi:carotenoid cleavage dioxygenase-like enzyme